MGYEVLKVCLNENPEKSLQGDVVNTDCGAKNEYFQVSLKKMDFRQCQDQVNQ